MSLRKLIATVDCTLIKDVLVQFLTKKGNPLKEDYPLHEVESFFENHYSKGGMSNKDIVAIWNFEKIIKQYKEV